MALFFRQTVVEQRIKEKYKSVYKKEINFENPLTYTDKLITRVIEINRGGFALFTTLSDKFLVREYIREKIGEDYLIELFWHGTDAKQIPFQNLPAKCVVKTNHWSGEVIIFDENISKDYVIQQMQKLLKQDYLWVANEYQYSKIKPQIIIEKYLEDTENEHGPLDYRIWCFDGKPEVIQLDNHIHNIDPFYDTNWNKLPVTQRRVYVDIDIKRPENLGEMLDIAAKLSSGFDFVRVDLYNIHGKIYFGELTFTPRAGLFKFTPDEWDLIFGQKWNLVRQNELKIIKS